MKKVLKNLLMMWGVILSVGVLISSCSEDVATGPGTNPGPNPGGQSVVNLTWSEEETEASDYGVKIVAGVTSTNQLRFECIPGDYAKSYRLDVIPLAKVYDMIYTLYYDEIGNGKKVTDEESRAFLKELLFSEGGSAGFTFSPDGKGMEDYWTGHEFNWGADGYSQFEIVPNAEYLVIAVGCEDENGANGRDMSILRIETNSVGLIGDPSVTVSKLQTGWSAFGVTFEANEDAKYYYVFSVLSESYERYIRDFGEEMFREMIRFSASPTTTDNQNNLHISSPIWDDPKKPITVLTVATDENFMPGELETYEFTMPLVPEDTDPANATVTWDEAKTSAYVANFDITCDKFTRMVCYRYMPKDEWVKSGYENDSTKLATLAYELSEEGWIEYNKNYKFSGSMEEGNLTPSGEGSTMKSWQYILSPNTEYVLAYIAVNGYEQYTDVKSIEFKTKPLTVANFTGTGVLNVKTKPSVNSLVLEFEPSDDVSLFYHILVDQKNPEWDNNKDSLYNDLMNSYYNFLYPDELDGKSEAEIKDHLSFSYVSLQPNTKYYLLYVTEDWNGKISEPQYIEINTLSLQAGDNPRLAIEANSFYNESLWCNQLDVTYKPLQDVGLYYYGVFNGMLSEHPKTYAEAKKYWTDLVLNGPDGEGNYFIAYAEKTQHVTLKFFGIKDPDLKYKVAAAVPFGANDKQGELSLVYYDIDEDRVITDLTELWDDAPVPVATSKVNSSVPMPRTRTQAPYKSVYKASLNNSKISNTAKTKQIKANIVNQKFEDFVKTLK